MNPTDEAAQILTRMFEALARQIGKTLNARSRADIKRACELLASAGAELDDLLDELPPAAAAPAPERQRARDYTTMPIEVERWREQRRTNDE
nr:H-NS histone family [uncultured bacterium]